MAATGDKAEYTEYFKKKMKEHGLEGIEGVDDAKLKKFYEDVDKGWKADKESSVKGIANRIDALASEIRTASKR